MIRQIKNKLEGRKKIVSRDSHEIYKIVKEALHTSRCEYGAPAMMQIQLLQPRIKGDIIIRARKGIFGRNHLGELSFEKVIANGQTHFTPQEALTFFKDLAQDCSSRVTPKWKLNHPAEYVRLDFGSQYHQIFEGRDDEKHYLDLSYDVMVSDCPPLSGAERPTYQDHKLNFTLEFLSEKE